jgi:hypothetical protein
MTDVQHWKDLVTDRVADAETLLLSNRWQGAYYLAGYAIETALKVCVLQRLQREPTVILEEGDRYLREVRSHNLLELLKRAGLAKQVAGGWGPDSNDTNVLLQWVDMVEWNEGARYRRDVTEGQARAICQSILGLAELLTWIKSRWV